MPRVTHAHASDQERASYLSAALVTQTALEAGVRLLKARQALTADPDESRQITVAVLDLKSAVLKIQADIIAFVSEQRAIQPPSADQVNAIKRVARGLDQMVANSTLTTDVLRAATAVLDSWNATA